MLYVKKEILNKRFPKLKNIKYNGIKIENSHYESFYEIIYEYTGYNRLIKIFKILNRSHPHIEFIEFCYDNSSSYNDVIEYVVGVEISKEIDKRIINDLIKIGKRNNGIIY